MRYFIFIILFLSNISCLFSMTNSTSQFFYINELSLFYNYDTFQIKDSDISMYSSGFGIQYSLPTPIRIITLNYNQSISSIYNKSSFSVSIPPITAIGFIIAGCFLLAYPGNDAGGWLFFPFVLLSMVSELNIGIGVANLQYSPLNIDSWYFITPISINICLPLFFFNKDLDRHTIKFGTDIELSEKYNSIILRFGYSLSF